MKFLISIIFLIALYFEQIAAVAIKQQSSTTSGGDEVSCRESCSSNGQLNCPCLGPKIAKRDTVQDLIRKANKKMVINTPQPRKLALPKYARKGADIRPKAPKHQIASHQDLQKRLKELKSRMASGKPILMARANLVHGDKSNLIEQFKTRQAELLAKFRKASDKGILRDSSSGKQHIRNRIDVADSKLGSVHQKLQEKVPKQDTITAISSTTQAPPSSSVIVLMTSSTTSQPTLNNDQETQVVKGDGAKAVPKVIERIKEKQKEAVSKIKDKISRNTKEDA